ncbi:MAG: hypothetical protein WCQ50_21340 [Spirochaetota bacterium]
MKKAYTFDISEFRPEFTTGKTNCTSTDQDGTFECDMTMDWDTTSLTARDIRTIKTALRSRFEDDLKSVYGPAIQIRWVGDKKSILLRLQKGDKVRFKGGEGEVIYVIPDRCGVRTTEGKVLNFDFKSLEHFLFKKI